MARSIMNLVLLLSVFLTYVNSSAIPMWEYLSKEEKMSYLYSTFANQVEDFCNGENEHTCSQELLKYGSDKLKEMPDDHLDTMDPYARGASNLIWESMLEGHEMMKASTQKPKQETTTAKPNSYDDQSFYGYGQFGEQSEASARVETVYRVPPPQGLVYNIRSGTPQYFYPNQFDYYQSKDRNDDFYPKYQRNEETSYATNKYQSSSDAPLTGPMVVKVYPDGRPVGKTEQEPLPQDDDLKQYHMSKAKIPSF